MDKFRVGVVLLVSAIGVAFFYSSIEKAGTKTINYEISTTKDAVNQKLTSGQEIDKDFVQGLVGDSVNVDYIEQSENNGYIIIKIGYSHTYIGITSRGYYTNTVMLNNFPTSSQR